MTRDSGWIIDKRQETEGTCSEPTCGMSPSLCQASHLALLAYSSVPGLAVLHRPFVACRQGALVTRSCVTRTSTLSSYVLQHSLHTYFNTSYVLQHSLHTYFNTSYILQHSPYILQHSPYVLQHYSYLLQHSSHILILQHLI